MRLKERIKITMRQSLKGFNCSKCGLRLYSSKTDESYLVRRLKSLKEQNVPQKDDPLVKLMHPEHSESIVDDESELQKLYEELPQKTFNKKYEADIRYAKIPEHVNAQSKDIALSKPWNGHEAPEDTSLRMILDSVTKPIKGSTLTQPNLGFAKIRREEVEARSVRVSKKLRRKLEDAQDNVLKYKADKHTNTEKREQSEFRALYAEKFTPIGSFEKLHSLAERRIEECMKLGGFNDLQKIRGKPSEVPRPNEHIGRTELYLNDMLIRQKIAPPWIETQSRINADVNDFRAHLIRKFEEDLIYNLKRLKLIDMDSNINSIKSSIQRKYGSLGEFIRIRFANYKVSQRSYIETKITSLNSALRTYNLQAPLSTQKLYLLPERELQKVLESTKLEDWISKKLRNERKPKASARNLIAGGSSDSMFKMFKFW